MHVVTKGLFTFPAKAFFVLAHNQPIEAAELESHPLVQKLKDIKTKAELLQLTSQHVNDWSNTQTEALLPKPREHDLSKKIAGDIDLVTF